MADELLVEVRDGDIVVTMPGEGGTQPADTASARRSFAEPPPELATGRLSRPRNVPCEGDDDRWQPSKPDWRPWRVSCDNARATPVPIRMGTFRSGPMGSQTKCEIPLCRCGGRGARCRYAREFFPQAQPWVCEIGSHRSVASPVLLLVVFPSFG
jgi:hypothetical protein